ncbi:MAG: CHAT domain-containing tetratricopeptide repeat protein [Candidatus Azotimanducaceae bacterium]
MKRIVAFLLEITIFVFCVPANLSAEDSDYDGLLEKSFEGSSSLADLSESDLAVDSGLIEAIRLQLSSEYKVESLQASLLGALKSIGSDAQLLSVPDLQQLQTIVSTFVPLDLEGSSNLASPSRDEIRAFSRAEKLFVKAEKRRGENRIDRALDFLERGEARAKETLAEHWLLIAVYRRSGAIALEMGSLSRASESYGKALNQSANLLGPRHPQTIAIASKLAKVFENGGNYDSAISLRNTISETMESIFGPTHFLALKEYELLSFAYRSSGDIDSAFGVLDYVCGVYDSTVTNFHPNSLKCRSILANFFLGRGNLSKAYETRNQIAGHFKFLGQESDRVAVENLIELGELSRQKGDLKEAEKLLEKTINLAKNQGFLVLERKASSYLSRAYADSGDLEKASIVLERLLVDLNKDNLKESLNYLNTKLDLGGVYQRLSMFAEAEIDFQYVVDKASASLGDLHPTTLVSKNNLGNLYEQLGIYDQAEPLLKSALDSSEAIYGVSHPQTSRISNNLALLFESQGNFEEAESLYRTSYKNLTSSLGLDHPDTYAVLNNLAFLYMLMEDYPRAAQSFSDLIEKWGDQLGGDHPNVLKAINNLGRVYLRSEKYDAASNFIHTALTGRQEKFGELHVDTIRSHIDYGKVFRFQRRLKPAEDELLLALKLSESVLGPKHPYVFEILNELAVIYEILENFDKAVSYRELVMNRRTEFFDQMLWAVGENAREGYLRVHRPEFFKYLSLLADLGDSDSGKKIIEASMQRKGLLLRINSQIQQISRFSKDSNLSGLARKLELERKNLAALTLSGPTAETVDRHPSILFELEKKVGALEAQLGRYSQRFRSSIAGHSVEELEKKMRHNSALVDMFVYGTEDEKKLLAGVVIKSANGNIDYRVVEFGGMDKIEGSIEEYREIIQDEFADEDELLDIGQSAYDILWAPVADLIGEINYVYIVPDGLTNVVPYNALINPEEDYLIEEMELHFLTSSSDILSEKESATSGDFVIFAGPDYDSSEIIDQFEAEKGSKKRASVVSLGVRGAGNGLRGLSFSPLPGAEEEGKVISNQVMVRGALPKLYLGNSAKEKALLEKVLQPDVLHIATHGFFLEADETLRKRILKMQRSMEIQVPPPGDNPLLRSGLAFAGINKNAAFLGEVDSINDGVLTAMEVLSLDLFGTKLVVLSACETGLGEIHEGEGIFGLRRSFQEAGVGEIVSSLWEVSDAGTKALMTIFYRLLVEGYPAREALRKAQIDLMRSPQWGYPYVWSAFTVFGQGSGERILN